MANNARAFEDIFRAPNPLATESFRLFLQNVAAASDPEALRDFFANLNGELYRARLVDNEDKVSWAQDMFRALLNANPPLIINTLDALLKEMKWHFHDPLADVVFATAWESPPLLSLLGDVVQLEDQLVQFRARAVEALATKGPQSQEAPWIRIDTQTVLRSLNDCLDGLRKGSRASRRARSESLLKLLHAVDQALSSPGAPPGSGQADEQGEPGESDVFRRSCRNAIELVQDALRKLAIGARTPAASRSVLDVLRANTPLPAWHPAAARVMAPIGHAASPNIPSDAAGEAAPWSAGRTGSSLPDAIKAILALIVDKAIEFVVGLAGMEWSSTGKSATTPRARKNASLWPVNQPVLESVLVDSAQPPKLRTMAAALLRILAYTLPTIQMSPRVRLYSDLFLMPCHPMDTSSRFSPSDSVALLESEDDIDLLLDALDEPSDYVRWTAAQACYMAARVHPEWFQPTHSTKLLPLLGDEHRGVRLAVMRTVEALASFRDPQLVTVVQDLAARLDETVYRRDDEETLRRDLEVAIGATLDRLRDDVGHLQREVQRLEDRRRQLLDHLEKQAVRVGEELHHETLNTLCGYLATAIDERDYGEAKRRLDELVTDLRRIMNDLYPKDLETEGLLPVVRRRLEYAGAYMQRRGRPCTVTFDCPAEITNEIILESLVEGSHFVLLYRIVSEAINNLRKHSCATRVGVTIRSPQRRVIEVAIWDNGVGGGGPFVENVGMALMRRRAEEIGAEIEYHRTAPEGGTTVIIRLTQHRPLTVAALSGMGTKPSSPLRKAGGNRP